MVELEIPTQEMSLQSPTFILPFPCPFIKLRELQKEGRSTQGFPFRSNHLVSSLQGWETNICVEPEAAIWSPQFPASGEYVHPNWNLASDTYNTRAPACALRITPAFGEKSLSYRPRNSPSPSISLLPPGWPLFITT